LTDGDAGNHGRAQWCVLRQEGYDWDATIVKLIEHPIVFAEASGAPIDRSPNDPRADRKSGGRHEKQVTGAASAAYPVRCTGSREPAADRRLMSASCRHLAAIGLALVP